MPKSSPANSSPVKKKTPFLSSLSEDVIVHNATGQTFTQSGLLRHAPTFPQRERSSSTTSCIRRPKVKNWWSKGGGYFLVMEMQPSAVWGLFWKPQNSKQTVFVDAKRNPEKSLSGKCQKTMIRMIVTRLLCLKLPPKVFMAQKITTGWHFWSDIVLWSKFFVPYQFHVWSHPSAQRSSQMRCFIHSWQVKIKQKNIKSPPTLPCNMSMPTSWVFFFKKYVCQQDGAPTIPKWSYKWFPRVTTPMSGGTLLSPLFFEGENQQKLQKTRSKIPTKSRGVPFGGSSWWRFGPLTPLKPELFAAKRTHLHLGIYTNLSSVGWWYASMIGHPKWWQILGIFVRMCCIYICIHIS